MHTYNTHNMQPNSLRPGHVDGALAGGPISPGYGYPLSMGNAEHNYLNLPTTSSYMSHGSRPVSPSPAMAMSHCDPPVISDESDFGYRQSSAGPAIAYRGREAFITVSYHSHDCLVSAS
jgi:hypothetical protein